MYHDAASGQSKAAASHQGSGNSPYPVGCLTAHALHRSQQRAFSPEVICYLLDHGVRTPAGKGAEVVYLTDMSRLELAGEVGRDVYGRHARKLATAYAIIAADGTVVTVGHRSRRIGRRNPQNPLDRFSE